ncbi:hypothetical protein [Dyella amyloliquefaciens]|uniref:hypothetical protein n=1 Tax=Dyella amyloliquefaciens TaxID=1770545 RepID=UPI00102EB8E5|nr:hypothetical protein [Dyella amyloliquefaciens]
MKSDRTYWFAPKRFGFGYSPSSWQGWALVAAYGVLMIAMPRFLHDDANVRAGTMVVLTIVFLVVAFSKTRTSRS